MPGEPIIYLITGDAGLRSAVAAGLGIAGITVVTVDSCQGLDTGAHQQRIAMLIVDAMLTEPDPAAWIAGLRQRAQGARIILLTDHPSIAWGEDVTVVAKDRAAPVILALAERWSAGA